MTNFISLLISLAVSGFLYSAMAADSPDLNPKEESAIQAIVDYVRRASDSFLVAQGRLTLTSGVPVTTSNVTSSTVYYTNYHGNKIGLYDGSTWKLYDFSEVSVAVPATTTTPFDIFAYSNSGNLALETVNWSNDSTRATSLTTQDGVYVKSGAVTRRYLGTARTNSVSGQTEDSANYRLLWNMHNREERRLAYLPAFNNSWSYASATPRAANGNSAYRVGVVIGVAGPKVQVSYTSMMYHVSNASYTCVGVDTTAACSAAMRGRGGTNLLTSNSPVYHSETPAAGYHYYQMEEYSDGSVAVFLDYTTYYQLIGTVSG